MSYSSSPSTVRTTTTTTSQESSDEVAGRHDHQARATMSDYTGTKPKFKHIKTTPPRLSKSVCSSSVHSDSSGMALCRSSCKKKTACMKSRERGAHQLPPVGIFWDIENCQVPKNKSASEVVRRMRELFLINYREAEFLVVCDVKKERPQVIQELHDAQVNLIHVASTSKNAADEKLRQSLRRFAEIYTEPACVVLISGDVNFASDLSDLRYRKKIHVILVHNSNVADALMLCANDHYDYSTITHTLPKEKGKNQNSEPAYLMVSNLPLGVTVGVIKNRLSFLTSNCGGRISDVNLEEGTAVLRFSSLDVANRCEFI